MATVEKQTTENTSFNTSSFISNLQSAIDISESMPEENKNKVSRYFYRIGSYNYLLEEDMKVEYLTNSKVNKVPFLSRWHKGILSVRGIVMPVIDLHMFLNQQIVNKGKESNKQPSLLRIDHKDHTPIVFEIDSLPELINFKEFKVKKSPKTMPVWQQKYLSDGNQTIVQIDHKELLNQIIKAQ
ncbi:MAG: chemotaxis protein CheW [Cocleimonas sp.]